VLEKADLSCLILGKLEEFSSLKSIVESKKMHLISFPHYDGNALIDIGQPWQDIMSTYNPSEEIASVTFKDTWTILFTSGTTGSPK
ncbi:hypothetical protein ABFV57_32915, partial [Pseudomonas neuropathica]